MMTGSAQASPPCGQNERTSAALPNVVPAAVPAGCAAPRPRISAAAPPTARHETMARTIAPPISKQYCRPCVAVMPQ